MCGEAAGARRVDAVCVGEALIDLFSDQPSRDGAAVAGVERWRRLLGGAPANVAVGLARQGISAGLLALVGADGFGDFICGSLGDEGVELCGVDRRDARTGLAFVCWSAAGERDFLFYRHETADALLDRAHVDQHAALVRGARVLHVCGNALVNEPAAGALRRAVAIAREADVLVSFDLNLRLHVWPSVESAATAARELVSRAQLVKADMEEAAAVTGESEPSRAARALADLGADLVAVTLGDRGALLHSATGEVRLPAPRVAAIDTTGAGDAFSSALLAGALATTPPGAPVRPTPTRARWLLERACWAGAQACTAVGAVPGLPHELGFPPPLRLLAEER